MVQMQFRPSTALRQRMSDLPSPSKSPTPTIFQFRSSTDDVRPVKVAVVPFIVHAELSPVIELRQKRSDLPSALKSAGAETPRDQSAQVLSPMPRVPVVG